MSTATTTDPTSRAARITELNDTARTLQMITGEPWSALKAAARRFGLVCVAASPSAAIYRAEDGQLFNCHTDALSHKIEASGLGFDGQAEWHTQVDADA